MGRTGTLISIDMALTLAPIEGTVDIPRMLTMLRRQRMKMVQTAVSYGGGGGGGGGGGLQWRLHGVGNGVPVVLPSQPSHWPSGDIGSYSVIHIILIT